MNYTKDDIRRANDLNIIDVAGKLGVTMKRQGVRMMALCLWHSENTPSMQIGGNYNMCRCYACGARHGVIDMVMAERNCNFKEAMKWLTDEYPHIQSVTAQVSRKPEPPRQPVLYFNMAYVEAHVSTGNALSRCLLQRFPQEVVDRVTAMYRLGHDERMLYYEHTWFPSIDRHGRVRNIKVQGYCTNPGSPMFGHSIKGQTMWLGKKLRKDEVGEFDNSCLFGEHLLGPPSCPPKGGDVASSEGSKPVILVESPKNAVVGACWSMVHHADTPMTWVAVGNKGMLRRDVLEPLRGRQVIVIPDRDAVDEWKRKIDTMHDLATFAFSTFCTSQAQVDNKKLDIADLILDYPATPRG